MANSTNQVMLLQLAAAQLSLSLEETEKPFNDLTGLFLEIVSHQREVGELLKQKPLPDLAKIQQLHLRTEEKVKSSIVDFQFYDRMSQRLHHILSNLQQAILVLSNADDFNDEDQWNGIFKSVEESYTMGEETELYQAIRSGEGFESAVKKLINKTQQQPVETSIELF